MQHACRHACLLYLAAAAFCLSGCTSFSDYVHNGFKVGPEYTGAKAAVAPQWMDASDVRVRSHAADLSRWWKVMNDPVLDNLICHAYHQNINLKDYATRILQARAQLGIDTGNLFPQTQDVNGTFLALGGPWNLGFSLAWELDFWGTFRRTVLADKAQLEASVENYDAVLVTLLCDVTQYYVQMRSYQEQIRLSKDNAAQLPQLVEMAKHAVALGSPKYAVGAGQLRNTQLQIEATVPALEIQLRQSQDQLCLLLGVPPTDLQARLGQRPIPTVPREIVLGIPAQLLERVPSVRSAERAAAAQAQQIGIAQAALYPHISITGTLGYQAPTASQLFTPAGFVNASSFGPTFQWNVLEYGRIVNNVRLQDAKFQQALLDYRTAVLTANHDAEDGLVAFLKSQGQMDLLQQSIEAIKDAQTQYDIVDPRHSDLNQLNAIHQSLVQSQILKAQAQAAIALGLVQIYRALGGGWEIRLGQQRAESGSMPLPAGMENMPVPSANPVVGPGNPEPQASLHPPRPKQN
jgi:NodT family efflux transporter outer membrane factor (OMF) lipoprotein